jgi:GNAT superfamily N-acetyltransferase
MVTAMPSDSSIERQAPLNASLRPATAYDAPRVTELLIGVRDAFMPYAPAVHSKAQMHEWVVRSLVPSGGVTVAEWDGEVVGIMATEASKAVSWIHQMAVAPRLVNRGVGTLLLAHALRTLVPPIRLYTFQANAGARRFYERHGFEPLEFTDGQANEEHCPDVLYELPASRSPLIGQTPDRTS